MCASAPASPKVRAPPRSPSSLYPRADRPRSSGREPPRKKRHRGRAREPRKGREGTICFKYISKRNQKQGNVLFSFAFVFFFSPKKKKKKKKNGNSRKEGKKVSGEDFFSRGSDVVDTVMLRARAGASLSERGSSRRIVVLRPASSAPIL